MTKIIKSQINFLKKTYILFKLVKFERSGNEPVSKLLLKIKSVNPIACESSGGIIPSSKFALKSLQEVLRANLIKLE